MAIWMKNWYYCVAIEEKRLSIKYDTHGSQLVLIIKIKRNIFMEKLSSELYNFNFSDCHQIKKKC